MALFVDKVEDLTPDQLMERILVDVYADPASGVPRQVLVPTMPGRCRGGDRLPEPSNGAGPVVLRVPVRGPKRALLQTVEQNAGEAFVRHRLHRTSDHNSRARALESLQQELGLPDAPLRIECYDMSHLQGTDYVGSMVVFEDGLPKKSDYRHFRVATVPGNDDYAAMEEVLTRRLTSLLAEDGPMAGGDHRSTRAARPDRERPDAGPARRGDGAAARRRRRFAYPPQLLLLDGGLGQLNVGVRVLDPRAHRADPRRRPGQELRGGLPARERRARPPVPAVGGRSTCSSACGTRPTASPSRTTAPCGASG